MKVNKTTQVLYGPEYTGLIQVKDKPFPLSHFRILHQSRSLTQSHTLSISHTHSHTSQVRIWRYGHWVTVYIDDRYLLFNLKYKRGRKDILK